MTGEKVELNERALEAAIIVGSNMAGEHLVREIVTEYLTVARSDAPAEMPGVEEIARIVCRRVHEALSPNAEDWRPGELEQKVNIYWPRYTREARAILDLFAPILAEKEREIRAGQIMTQKMRELAAKQKAAGKEYYDRALAAEAALAAERERCAKIVENFDPILAATDSTFDNIAAAIRAEGE